MYGCSMLFFPLEQFVKLFMGARVLCYTITLYTQRGKNRIIYVSITTENKIFLDINKTVEIMVCFCCRHIQQTLRNLTYYELGHAVWWRVKDTAC